jgi:GTPase-activator protein for Ras-like GTPase
MVNGQQIDQWYSVQTFADQQDQASQPAGQIRLKYLFKNELVLSPFQVEKWKRAIFGDNFKTVRTVWKSIVNERDDFARAVTVCIAGMENSREAIKSLIKEDVEETIDPNTIFRGNTIAIKIVDQFIKLKGAEYLKRIVGPLVSAVYQLKEHCEVDPSRCESADIAKRNVGIVLSLLDRFWKTIQTSLDAFPDEISVMFSDIKEMVTIQFPSSPDVKYGAISGFLFLRYFGPSIISVLNS